MHKSFRKRGCAALLVACVALGGLFYQAPAFAQSAKGHTEAAHAENQHAQGGQESAYMKTLIARVQRYVDRSITRLESLMSRALVTAKITSSEAEDQRRAAFEQKQKARVTATYRGKNAGATFGSSGARSSVTSDYAGYTSDYPWSVDNSLTTIDIDVEPTRPRSQNAIGIASRAGAVMAQFSSATTGETPTESGFRSGGRSSELETPGALVTTRSEEHEEERSRSMEPAATKLASPTIRRRAVQRPTTESEQARIAKVVRRGYGGLQSCFSHAAKGQGQVRARLNARVSWNRSGKVTRIKLKGKNVGGTLHGCIERRMQRWDFSPLASNGSASVPLVFNAQ